MKTKILTALLILSACLVYVACKKDIVPEQKNIENPIDNSISTNKYAVSVHNGRLKFDSFSEYFRITNLEQEEKKEFYSHLKELANFNSAAETNALKGGNKSATACDCEIDDEYINEIVDTHYMVEIENFIVKLNGCTRMVYVSDNLAANATAREAALIACNFTRNDFYVYTFDHVVEEELPIIRDSLNGINVAGRRCTEFAIGNRFAFQNAGSVVAGASSTIYNYNYYDLAYNNNGINGKIVCRLNKQNANGTGWKPEYQKIYYKLRCSSTINWGVNAFNWNNNSTNYAEHVLHSGTRLTNSPQGTPYEIKVRLVRNTPFASTPVITIIP
jgi:hypothetical protein